MRNRLRSYRLARDWKLETLAKELGNSPTHWSRVELADGTLNLHNMRLLGRFYGVPAADTLLTEDGGLTAEERRLIDTLREIPAALRDTYWNMVESHQSLRGASEIIPIHRHKS